jgi:hypothetical protein
MELLPIGSVVLLKGADKRLMIYGVKQINEEDNKEYDYIACLYPEGNIGVEYNYLFNHGEIEEIDFIGYMDAEFQLFRDSFQRELEKEANNKGFR